jgi:hypothetical protein
VQQMPCLPRAAFRERDRPGAYHRRHRPRAGQSWCVLDQDRAALVAVLARVVGNDIMSAARDDDIVYVFLRPEFLPSKFRRGATQPYVPRSTSKLPFPAAFGRARSLFPRAVWRCARHGARVAEPLSASETKVFYGNSIDIVSSKDGRPYSALANAFRYRKEWWRALHQQRQGPSRPFFREARLGKTLRRATCRPGKGDWKSASALSPSRTGINMRISGRAYRRQGSH